MPLKQQSLFDFEEPENSAPDADTVLHEADKMIVVDEVPVEVDIKVTVQNKAPAEVAAKSKRGRKKLSDIYITADLTDIPEDDILFQKKYYAIGAVAEMFKVNISLLRFWENEFDILKPKKNGKGDRHFRPEDVKNLKLIHHLLREKKYTIEGAKDFLRKNKNAEENFAVIEELKRMKFFLTELKLSL